MKTSKKPTPIMTVGSYEIERARYRLLQLETAAMGADGASDEDDMLDERFERFLQEEMNDDDFWGLVEDAPEDPVQEAPVAALPGMELRGAALTPRTREFLRSRAQANIGPAPDDLDPRPLAFLPMAEAISAFSRDTMRMGTRKGPGPDGKTAKVKFYENKGTYTLDIAISLITDEAGRPPSVTILLDSQRAGTADGASLATEDDVADAGFFTMRRRDLAQTGFTLLTCSFAAEAFAEGLPEAVTYEAIAQEDGALVVALGPVPPEKT